ncbi:MAG: type IX secretion system sortase PorU [Bacteroidales bacterium]|nr:type IX secretion system sortase PorU [Bacteroidales bacterium]
MEKKSWVLIAFFLLFILQPSYSQAQKIERTLSLNWTDNIIHHHGEDFSMEFLHFDGASYSREFSTLPSYYEAVEMPLYYDSYDVAVSNVQFESMSTHDASLVPAAFHQKELKVEAVSAFERNKPYLVLSFIPVVEVGVGEYRRIVAVTITVEGRGPGARKSGRTYAAQSVLNSGQWYRFTVSETGVYKVTYEDLTAMGMSTPIASASLALFGNGGEMLPEANATPRIDDLQELPISIVDGGDGIMNPGDYFLFYGHAPHTWTYDTNRRRFCHKTNIYSDATTYFVTNTPGVGTKKRISTADNSSLSANHTVNDYVHYDFFEKDQFNFGETGKDWYGDLFDITTQRTYTFSVPGSLQQPSRISIAGACCSSSFSYFSIKANNTALGNLSFPNISGNIIATLNSDDYTFTPSSGTLDIALEYSKPATSSAAYLDWIEIEVPCRLSMHSSQFPFCNPATVGTGNVTRFNITGASAGTVVWDVTDPANTTRMALSSEGGVYGFSIPTDTLRYFFAFDGSTFLSITPGGAVANQNLHGTGNADLLIVTHPKFLSQANDLAKFRRENDGLSVQVVTTEQVYNEFSGGSLDPMAIRDYAKMIYDRSNKQYPKYMLLFGRPSYDFRGRVSGTELYVPNYQYPASSDVITEIGFAANDDTFGLLDDNEGENASGLYDISVGRFPCSTIAQAKTAVEKSTLYTTHHNLLAENSTQISNFGDWRNMMAFVADDEEYNDFVTNADNFTDIVTNLNQNINFDKIYLDAFPQVSNAGGQRYPEVTTAINNRINRGSLFFTYIGHSGKDGWTAERVLENSDISKWTNKYNMPAMLTLSCTFGFYDRPAISPAELALFNSNGGVCAIITATREAWSSPNNAYGRHIFNTMFSTFDGKRPTIGDIERRAKNIYGGSSSSLAMFVLMGDPSMPLAIPTFNIVTDSINHSPVGTQEDTVSALTRMSVSGRVVDENGQTLTGFNGSVFPSVYDKAVTVTTLSNDPSSPPFEFLQQKSILFKGNCSVKDGHFNFSFYVPKDIDYNYGNGKISYYARSQEQDAAGSFSHFVIGGTDTNGIDDKEGPVIELFLNDEQFVNGGIVDANPTLIAKIRDNYGINTTGNGIGHDLTAILDNATESQIVLNDYYQTDRDSFNSGTVRYNLENLSTGKHTLLVRAWDINNNHSESELSFEVVSSEKFALSHVLNYPNPFTTHTEFFFEHNRNGGDFDILVQVYTISGKLVKTIQTHQTLQGNRSLAIPWDGRDDFGDRIGKGTYMYKVRVRNDMGETAEVIEKLVIL